MNEKANQIEKDNSLTKQVKKQINNNIISQYMAQMLQLMFERQQRYFNNINEMRVQIMEIQNRRKWDKIEVMTHYNYSNWRTQLQQQGNFNDNNNNYKDNNILIEDRRNKIVQRSSQQQQYMLDHHTQQQYNNINNNNQNTPLIYDHYHNDSSQYNNEKLKYNQLSQPHQQYEQTKYDNQSYQDYQYNHQNRKEQYSIRAQTQTKQTIGMGQLMSNSSEEYYIDRRGRRCASNNKEINYIYKNKLYNNTNINNDRYKNDNNKDNNSINSNINRKSLLQQKQQQQQNHYNRSEYISSNKQYYQCQYSFGQQQQQQQQVYKLQQSQQKSEQSQQQPMLIEWFNHWLEMINKSIQYGITKSSLQKVQSKHYSPTTTSNNNKKQSTTTTTKSTTLSGSVFLKLSLNINQCCNKLQIINIDTIFTAHHLVYLFLQHHPQLLSTQKIIIDHDDIGDNQLSQQQQLQKQLQLQRQTQQLQIFLTKLLQYIAIASIFISAKYHEIYHPSSIEVIDAFYQLNYHNQQQQQLDYNILANIQVKMQYQLVLGKWNFIIHDLQGKWLGFIAYMLGWCQDYYDGIKVNKNHVQMNILDTENVINKIQQKQLISQKTIKETYNIKIPQFILQTGMLNIHLYQYPISKKVGTAMTMYLKYWLKKSLHDEIIRQIWNIAKLDMETYQILQQQYFVTLKYCQDKQLHGIKNKYFDEK